MSDSKKCIEIMVPPEACLVRFGDRPEKEGVMEVRFPHRTIRGDLCYIHLDGTGRLSSIEIIGGRQPCMEVGDE